MPPGRTAPHRTVLIVGPKSFPPVIGGIETHVYEVSRRLASKGWEVTVAVPKKDGVSDGSTIEGVRVRACRSVDERHLLKLTMIPSIMKEVQSGGYDIVHAHDATGGFASAITPSRRRLVYTMHGIASHPEDWPTPFRQGIKAMQMVALGRADHVFCTDQRTAEAVTRHRQQVEVLPNGVNVDDFTKARLPIPDEYSGDFFRVIFVGRLNKVKGPSVLLNAISEVPQDARRKMKFVIIGDGPMRKEVIEASRSCKEIQYLGEVDHREIARYFVHSDAFVLPSLAEGIPISLLEAMASGLPSIASNVGGIESQIPAGAVLKVSPGDSHELCSAIMALYRDGTFRDRLSKAGRTAASEIFSWDCVVERLDRVYRTLV